MDGRRDGSRSEDTTGPARGPDWSDADAGTRSALEERLAPLRGASVGGFVVVLLLALVTVGVWRSAGQFSWAALVLAAVTLLVLAYAGLADLAHRVCAVVLATRGDHG